MRNSRRSGSPGSRIFRFQLLHLQAEDKTLRFHTFVTACITSLRICSNCSPRSRTATVLTSPDAQLATSLLLQLSLLLLFMDGGIKRVELLSCVVAIVLLSLGNKLQELSCGVAEMNCQAARPRR